ncbi:MAG: CPBP family intramembrane glutamic endopeptidase [Candidatus Acidiferrum sp.]
MAPWMARRGYRKAQRETAADPLAKVRLFRKVVRKQWVLIAIIGGLWLFGGISGAQLGIRLPYSWPITLGASAAILGFFVWSALRLRAKADKIREKMKDRAGMMLPGSLEELRWFAVMSFGAGIAEELLCRGFLFYYLSLYIPGINSWELMVLTSLLFGLAHLYQGWKGILGTGVAGVILAGLYVLTGSLFLPVLVHITGNMRAVVIFWPKTAAAMTPQQAT